MTKNLFDDGSSLIFFFDLIKLINLKMTHKSNKFSSLIFLLKNIEKKYFFGINIICKAKCHPVVVVTKL